MEIENQCVMDFSSPKERRLRGEAYLFVRDLKG
jgi:hypothetical protein